MVPFKSVQLKDVWAPLKHRRTPNFLFIFILRTITAPCTRRSAGVNPRYRNLTEQFVGKVRCFLRHDCAGVNTQEESAGEFRRSGQTREERRLLCGTSTDGSGEYCGKGVVPLSSLIFGYLSPPCFPNCNCLHPFLHAYTPWLHVCITAAEGNPEEFKNGLKVVSVWKVPESGACVKTSHADALLHTQPFFPSLFQQDSSCCEKWETEDTWCPDAAAQSLSLTSPV